MKRNRNAFFSLIFISACLVIAVCGYLILPDSSPDANNQNLELELLPPLSRITILKIPKPETAGQNNLLKFIAFGKESSYTEKAVKDYSIDKDSIRIIPYGGGKTELFAR